METANESIQKYDAETMACIQSAYEDLQSMIKEIFTNVAAIPNQLSIEEFMSLFERYDWEDIIIKAEDLDFTEISVNDKSVFECIMTELKNDCSIRSILSVRNNTFYQEWDGK